MLLFHWLCATRCVLFARLPTSRAFCSVSNGLELPLGFTALFQGFMLLIRELLRQAIRIQLFSSNEWSNADAH